LAYSLYSFLLLGSATLDGYILTFGVVLQHSLGESVYPSLVRHSSRSR
jgi:hypothetical protein